MSRFELTKSIEARKLNKRSGLPLPEPPATIAFGSIIENVKESRGMGRFTYLFELYESEWSKMESALHPVEEEAPAKAAPPRAARPAAPAPAPKAPPATPVPEAPFHWEEVATTHGPLLRAKLPGGWLIAWASALFFLPDPKYKWDGKTLP